jgi:hypothetical protein
MISMPSIDFDDALLAADHSLDTQLFQPSFSRIVPLSTGYCAIAPPDAQCRVSLMTITTGIQKSMATSRRSFEVISFRL